MITNKNNDKGFTLIELLIVIVILGILATVTVFAVSGISDRGTASACSADKKTIETAIEAYYAQNGAHATTAAQLGTFFKTPSTKYTLTYSTATPPAAPTIAAVAPCT